MLNFPPKIVACENFEKFYYNTGKDIASFIQQDLCSSFDNLYKIETTYFRFIFYKNHEISIKDKKCSCNQELYYAAKSSFILITNSTNNNILDLMKKNLNFYTGVLGLLIYSHTNCSTLENNSIFNRSLQIEICDDNQPRKFVKAKRKENRN